MNGSCYCGKTKDVTSQGGLLLLQFKDSVLGRNGQPDPGGNIVVGTEPGRGAACRAVALFTFRVLEHAGIPTHFRGETAGGILVEPCARIPLEVIVRNAARGSFLVRYGALVAPGAPLGGLVELTLKDDAADDPLITPETVRVLGLATAAELAEIDHLARAANHALAAAFAAHGLVIDDFKLEFGRRPDGSLQVIDEIGVNSMRVRRGEEMFLSAHDLAAAVQP